MWMYLFQHSQFYSYNTNYYLFLLLLSFLILPSSLLLMSSESGSQQAPSEVLTREGLLTAGTAKTYNVYRKKFATFMHLDTFDCKDFLPENSLTDANISDFITFIGDECEFKPHVLKQLSSALSTDLIPYRLRSFSKSPEDWPLTTIAMKKWRTTNKSVPYFPQSSSPLSTDAVHFLLEMDNPDPNKHAELVQYKAYLCWTVFTAMRNKDIHELKSNNVKCLPASPGRPRRYIGTLETTKNDPYGTGDISQREYFVPCQCWEHLSKNEKRSFAMKLKKTQNVTSTRVLLALLLNIWRCVLIHLGILRILVSVL